MKDFFAEITKDTNGRLTYIPLPFNAKEVFQKDKGPWLVRGVLNDIAYRSKLISRGSGKFIMTVDKSLQKSVGFNGEPMTVHVTMTLDENEIKTAPDIDLHAFVHSDMEICTAIRTRQSIRDFTADTISRELINTIIYAGMCAPTAKDKRPFDFIVIEEKKLLNELSESNPNARMLANAACAIVICGDRNKEGLREFLYADCAAAAQNMLLSAHGLKLGGVWCGVAANSQWYKLLAERLKLPPKVEPVSVLALGYPAAEKELRPKWTPGKIHYEIW